MNRLVKIYIISWCLVTSAYEVVNDEWHRPGIQESRVVVTYDCDHHHMTLDRSRALKMYQRGKDLEKVIHNGMFFSGQLVTRVTLDSMWVKEKKLKKLKTDK